MTTLIFISLGKILSCYSISYDQKMLSFKYVFWKFNAEKNGLGEKEIGIAPKP